MSEIARAPLGGGSAVACTAKSKRSQKQCRNAALVGATKCRMHGGSLERQPSATLTHGLTSKFVKVDDLPKILERVRALDTVEGRTEAVKVGHALTDVRAENIPAGDEFHDVYFKARQTALKHIETLHNLEVKDEAPTMPTFVIATGNAQAERFEARGPDGHVTIRMLDGEPFMLVDGDWLRCVKGKDEETGAEVYRRVLSG